MHGLEADIWPASDDESLIASLEDWLGPHLHGLTRLGDLAALDLSVALLARLDWTLKRQARARIAVPPAASWRTGRGGLHRTGTHRSGARAAFLWFGRTPKLAGGRVPLRLALLSPAGRPIALTADIAGFWRGAWADARRDMRGRYPKHNWPENPLLP